MSRTRPMKKKSSFLSQVVKLPRSLHAMVIQTATVTLMLQTIPVPSDDDLLNLPTMVTLSWILRMTIGLDFAKVPVVSNGNVRVTVIQRRQNHSHHHYHLNNHNHNHNHNNDHVDGRTKQPTRKSIELYGIFTTT